jgi:hypothetical protein
LSTSAENNPFAHRITPVDAARGCAMLLVFVSHVKHHFVESAPELYWFLLSTTRIATPAFLLLSGFVIRHVLSTDRRGDAGIVLIDRALFLLIVAHILIGLDSAPDLEPIAWAFERTMITDAVGFAMVFAVLLRNLTSRTFLWLGTTIFLLSWAAASLVTFENEWSQWLGAVLFQWRGSANPEIDVPLVGYLGVFLIGMGLHAHLQEPLNAGNHSLIARRVFLYGLIGVAASLTGVLIWHLAKEPVAGLMGDVDTAARIREFLDPRAKRPPSPAYLAFYGGISLMMLAILFRGRPASIVRPMVGSAAVIGRASLVCFVVQDWLLFGLPRALGLNSIQSVGFWLMYLLISMILLCWVASVWSRIRGNRFLTVGLKAFVRRRQVPPVRMST